MSDIGDIWRQAAGKWSEVAAQIIEDDWDRATTCDEWTVRELVDHAMHWQGMGGGILGAGTASGDDWATIEPKLSAAFDDPSNLEGSAEQLGGMPKQQVAGLLIGDLLLHAWDLARSIGADETLPVAAVEATMAGLERMPSEMLRASKRFGEQVEVADDAGPQDRLLAYAGRTP